MFKKTLICLLSFCCLINAMETPPALPSASDATQHDCDLGWTRSDYITASLALCSGGCGVACCCNPEAGFDAMLSLSPNPLVTALAICDGDIGALSAVVNTAGRCAGMNCLCLSCFAGTLLYHNLAKKSLRKTK
jgi:hypothetical protein